MERFYNIKPISKNIFFEKGKITYDDRCEILEQSGLVVWFTGLSGSGKSTISKGAEYILNFLGKATYRLDGDNIRIGLNSDLGFSEEDRNENIRRIAEVAALFMDVGLITLVSCISPYKTMREFAKKRIGEDNFIEVYVKADIATCIKRDPKSLYKKAKDGEIQNFTGISSIYEEPENPDMVLDTTLLTIEESINKVVKRVLL